MGIVNHVTLPNRRVMFLSACRGTGSKLRAIALTHKGNQPERIDVFDRIVLGESIQVQTAFFPYRIPIWPITPTRCGFVTTGP
jgi:hypothetical protein